MDASMDVRPFRVEVLASASEVTVLMHGDININAEAVLATADAQVAAAGAPHLVLDFAGVGYIDSTGIALIVRLLAEARREDRNVVAVGLSEHYREIFEITRLSAYLTIADGPSAALSLEEPPQ